MNLFVLKVYNPFNLRGSKAFLDRLQLPLCKVLCGQDDNEHPHFPDECGGVGLEVGCHSQLFYLPDCSRAMLSQGSWTKHCAQDNFQVSPLHGCAEKALATRDDSGVHYGTETVATCSRVGCLGMSVRKVCMALSPSLNKAWNSTQSFISFMLTPIKIQLNPRERSYILVWMNGLRGQN